MIVVGLDPIEKDIQSIFLGENALIDWGKCVLDACCEYVSGVKFQQAYFEWFGLKGFQALSALIAYAKSHELVIIMDGKRGDIGSTSTAYASAYLMPINASGKNEFESDFMTVNPLMGEDCIDPFVAIANAHGKGIFLLLETSNNGASMLLKQPLIDGETVSKKIAQYVQKKYVEIGVGNNEFGPIGCVIGATNQSIREWRNQLPNSRFLMPGIGAQGGTWQSVKDGLTISQTGVWVPISRGITANRHELTTVSAYFDYIKKQAGFFYKESLSIVKD